MIGFADQRLCPLGDARSEKMLEKCRIQPGAFGNSINFGYIIETIVIWLLSNSTIQRRNNEKKQENCAIDRTDSKHRAF